MGVNNDFVSRFNAMAELKARREDKQKREEAEEERKRKEEEKRRQEEEEEQLSKKNETKLKASDIYSDDSDSDNNGTLAKDSLIRCDFYPEIFAFRVEKVTGTRRGAVAVQIEIALRLKIAVLQLKFEQQLHRTRRRSVKSHCLRAYQTRLEHHQVN